MLYEGRIEETLSRRVCIEADDEIEAENILRRLYDNGVIVLEADDFSDLDIAILGSMQEDEKEFLPRYNESALDEFSERQ